MRPRKRTAARKLRTIAPKKLQTKAPLKRIAPVPAVNSATKTSTPSTRGIGSRRSAVKKLKPLLKKGVKKRLGPSVKRGRKAVPLTRKGRTLGRK